MAKMLIIDGLSERRRALCQLFSTNGYHTAGVPHGADAARLMRNDTPDLILIDQDVPMGGLRTAQLIRMHPRHGRIPILFGLQPGGRAHVEQVLNQSRKIGISGLLTRPYQADRLLDKAKGCLTPPTPQAGTDGAPAAQPAAPTGPLSQADIRTQIREMTDLPTLSPSHSRIISIMSKDDAEVNVEELVTAVQSDQALTMRIMRIARSAYYGFTGNFLRSALTFLGMSRVRQIVQSATVLEVFKNQGESVKNGLDRKGAWAHSVACGLVMQRISRDNKQARHFTIGLLHDVGKLVLDLRFQEYSRMALEIAAVEQRPIYQVEKELIGLSHADIGYELANLWQLPNEITESILHHHEPSRAYRHKYLSSLVYLADVAARQMAIGDAGNRAQPSVEDPYAQKLHISLEEVLSERDDIAKQVEAIVATE